MRKFDTKVQLLKYKALKSVVAHAYAGDLYESIWEMPKEILNSNVPTMRCCVYKERAIMSQRVHLAMGGDKKNPNIIEVIDIACDDCPSGGYEVTDTCRGCLAHRCKESCHKNAITFGLNQKAHIDKSMCVECGLCAKACPYNAIVKRVRPCINSCKVNAISIDENGAAKISDEKCIQCGACVYQCPFGAVSDKSFILDVIDILKKSKENEGYKVYAVIAPSISSQFSYAKLGQVVSGIKALGFHSVVEAALGADLVADSEAMELYEKKFLTSSCCPAFVKYIENDFPTLKPYISHNLSPMAAISQYIKKTDPTSKIIFMGPCTAKKAEFQKESVREFVDSVITFEELQALFDGRELDITTLGEDVLDNASYFGRIFARCGGLSDAVNQALKENGVEDFSPISISCDGIEECKSALLKVRAKKTDANFIEGMACVGGCIGGAGCLTHGAVNKARVDKYGKEAMEKTIKDAINILK